MLLERESAIVRISDCIATIAHSGKILLLSGEAGIGKTSLLEHIRINIDPDIDVFWSGCDPLFTPRPYAPIYDFAHIVSADLLADLENGATPSVIVSRFFHALKNLDRPAILIIEDVHWADNASLDLLKYVVRLSLIHI